DWLQSKGTPGTDSSVEAVISVLWRTLDQLVRKSQQTVQHCGSTIRLEAVRTQANELPHRALLGYMDAQSIRKHVIPWQQMLAFFARTQQPHGWRSPPYAFTARQQDKWTRLWRAVQTSNSAPTAGSSGGHNNDATHGEDPLAPWLMSLQEQTCLEFCVELLNQRYRSNEYESALVCAMAVLGRGESGWRSPETYPPILSSVIKLARFFVVQKALWLDPAARQIIAVWQHQQDGTPWALVSADEDLADLATGVDCDQYDSRSSPGVFSQQSDPISSPAFGTPVHATRQSTPSTMRSPPGGTFPEHVESMVRKFMIRGTHGPMQTLLDWRTYGLRVHYNTSTPGHIAWLGSDEVLYKDVQFTMGRLRSFLHGLVDTTKSIL
ncbi:putative telomere-associated RecQ helicase, partial [Aspergillus neoniger CBS 115656]